MVESVDILAYVLFFIGVLITLMLPIPIKDEYRLFIITAVIFVFLIIILSRYNTKLEKQNQEIIELNKRFKTIEELNDIKLDIRELKREVLKNE